MLCMKHAGGVRDGGGCVAALSAEGGRYPELSAVLRAAQRASVPSSARLKHARGVLGTDIRARACRAAGRA